jgi:DNA-binding response OmpR family regulator
MPKKILVVDDETGSQLLLSKRLESEGYDIIQALDGQQGLERFLAGKPDLILTDIVMPRMSGIEFFKRLKQLKDGQRVPVIVISKRALMKDCFEEGSIEGFFAKPFDMEELVKKINAVLSRHEPSLSAKILTKQAPESPDAADDIVEQAGKIVYVCDKCEKKVSKKTDHCPYCGSGDLSAMAFYD